MLKHPGIKHLGLKHHGTGSLCALIALSLTTACASNGLGKSKPGGSSAPATAGSAKAKPSASASPTRDTQAIRSVDLGAQTYRVGGSEVSLTKGSATDGSGRQITLGDNPVYSDADEDGYDDAAIEIKIADGNGFEGLWYILHWDPTKSTFTQIDDPFARSFRCGDNVSGVTAATGGFQVQEQRTDGTEANCAETPHVAITRTVGLKDGWLLERSPHHGYGGICPAFQATEGFDADGAALRIGPSLSAPLITDKPTLVGLLERPNGVEDRPGWQLLGYKVAGAPTVRYGPCAWLPAGG